MNGPTNPSNGNPGPAMAANYKRMIAKPAPTPDKDPDQDKDKDGPNYTKTNDPDVYMGKHGVPIKRSEYQQSLSDPKNNMKFNSFEDYADYTGGWAKPTTSTPAQQAPARPKIVKPTPDMSDKAKGLSNNYYTPNH